MQVGRHGYAVDDGKLDRYVALCVATLLYDPLPGLMTISLEKVNNRWYGTGDDKFTSKESLVLQ